MTTNMNLQYNVPKINLQVPGRQNRHLTGTIKITPGITESYEFYTCNTDGIPLSLLNYKIVFVIFSKDFLNNTRLEEDSTIMLKKQLLCNDPYSGKFTMVLSNTDTLNLINSGGDLRWAIYLIDVNNQVFPLEVASGGNRVGNIIIDNYSGLPSANRIL